MSNWVQEKVLRRTQSLEGGQKADLSGILLSKQGGGWGSIGGEHCLEYENPEACRGKGGWL